MVSQNGIQKLESVGIKYLGMVDGLQAFQVPPEVKGSKDAWNVYREILGKCSGRDKGQKISICTMAGFGNFNQYLNDYPGSSYYVFYNMGDPLSPYQFHYESNQFMDKNDDDIIESKLFINLSKFLLKKGLSEKLISIINKEKLGLEITDDEKNKIKNMKYVLNKASLFKSGKAMFENQSSEVIQKLLSVLHLFPELQFLTISDCESADFSDVDVCSLRNLVWVVLKGTKNNLEEQGYQCVNVEGVEFFSIS